MEQEKIKSYYQMWNEAWKLFRKWSLDFKDDDPYWQKCVSEAEDFAKQYKGQSVERFAYRIASDILEELENVAIAERTRGKE